MWDLHWRDKVRPGSDRDPDPDTAAVFFRAVIFTTFGQAKEWVNTLGLGHEKYFLAGFLTGFTVSFVEGPIDFLKSQVQVRFFLFVVCFVRF